MYIKGFFNLFCFLLIFFSFTVISLKNSVQSIVGLIASFVVSSFLLLTLNCEFFAFLFLIVYVGAIAVLFLFVLMMLELKHLNNKNSLFQMLLCLSIPMIFFMLALPFIRSYFLTNPYYSEMLQANGWVFIYNGFNQFYVEDNLNEIEVLGQLLYTKYALQFLLIGLILTLAIMCVGVLTINRKNSSLAKTTEFVVSRVF
jgi:NADH-quinone oxidoreductase subunit J